MYHTQAFFLNGGADMRKDIPAKFCKYALPPVFILFIPMLAGSSIFWYGHSIVEALTAVIALTILLCGF